MITRHSIPTFLFVGALTSFISISHAAELTMQQVAVKAERPAGTPDYADVCFRYGWIRETLRPDLNKPKAHDVEFPTVEDAKKALRAFHATRVDWFYPGSHTANPGADYVTKQAKAFIDWCHDRGMKVGGAMNTLTTHKPWNSGARTNMGRYRGDPNNPEFVAAAVAWGKARSTRAWTPWSATICSATARPRWSNCSATT
jgi:hypothetical protein